MTYDVVVVHIKGIDEFGADSWSLKNGVAEFVSGGSITRVYFSGTTVSIKVTVR